MTTYTIVVTGSRDWTNVETVKNVLLEYRDLQPTIIHGGCRGLDLIAKDVAEKIGYKTIEVKADWQHHGRAAGPIRNRKMLDMSPKQVIAFHDNIASSLGTKDTINESMRRGIPTYLVKSGGYQVQHLNVNE
jgi:hypothetical protein